MRTNTEDLMRGPKGCWRSVNVAAPCDVCGRYSTVTHTPMDRMHLHYCAQHCQACNPAALDYERVALALGR